MQGTSNCNVCDLSTELYGFGIRLQNEDVWNFKKHIEMVKRWRCFFFFFPVLQVLLLRCCFWKWHCRDSISSISNAERPHLWTSPGPTFVEQVVWLLLCGKGSEILLPGQVWKLALKLKDTSHLKAFWIFLNLFGLEQLNQVLSNFLQLFGWWYFELLRCLVGKHHFKTGHGGGGHASKGAETLVNLSWSNVSSIPKSWMNFGVGFDLNEWKLYQNVISLCQEILTFWFRGFWGWSLTCLETLRMAPLHSQVAPDFGIFTVTVPTQETWEVGSHGAIHAYTDKSA